MIHPSEVSAVLVTRGDQDLSEITDNIEAAGVTDIVVWDNSQRENLSCYGRYAGIAEAKNEYIFHQDDDLVSPIPELLDLYDPVRDRWAIVANNRIDEEWPLTAIGCVFHRDLADCFDDYIAVYGEDADFHRVCDVVFAYQWPYRRVVLGYRDLAWASAPGASMYLEEGHYAVRVRARARTLALPQMVSA
jgi:hypothetical protein